MDTLHFSLEYEWEPFTVSGQQLTFEQLAGRRLVPNECSHHRSVVFKWEGLVTRVSDHVGQLGILFGQADDIAARIYEYVTAKTGMPDYEYREQFLLSGDIRLFVLRPHRVMFDNQELGMPYGAVREYWIAKRRAVFAEMLALECHTRRNPYIWVVNRGLEG